MFSLGIRRVVWSIFYHYNSPLFTGDSVSRVLREFQLKILEEAMGENVILTKTKL